MVVQERYAEGRRDAVEAAGHEYTATRVTRLGAVLSVVSEPGLSSQEEGALRRVRFLADLMDDAVTIPGTDKGIGLDSLVGLVPVSGDIVTAVISLYTVGEALRAGADGDVVGKMLFNIVVDLVVGSIPILGDIFDIFWKSNVRNAELLEEHLTAP